ncbi:hypothetical protein K493DRAFT_317139 [Basidiobolus meristosporus CBS 931.73]|uniref:Amino acid transporter transmembrane domain-containing protein n=1 Tax=Basidiobolus meristosporus CBS 931.73 TaxID=1314790 RepID=A0A1Y1Y0W5_9FUNG|nr:hypothetical protein K493DRAFT_317139 [Basidiobolus meristosporus CBS 931.73]|eukprot:ORX91640.1 hypothetical protein K493DRAFT_317139 [Basidiobolus meristosporus CBS 931.73]
MSATSPKLFKFDEKNPGFEVSLSEDAGRSLTAVQPTTYVDDDEDEPSIIIEEPGEKTSAKKAFLLLIKAFVGTGILFLPKAFYNGGLLFSIFILILVGSLTTVAIMLLVKVRLQVPGEFGEIGGILFGRGLQILVRTSITISQLGFCCAYFIFVSQNLYDLTHTLSGCKVDIPVKYFIFMQLIIYVPFGMVRKIKAFSYGSLIANVFILFGIIYIFYVDIDHFVTAGAGDFDLFNSKDFPLFIGTALFSFEGIGLVLPVVNSMKDPKRFPTVLAMVIVCVIVLFVGVGAVSYAAFGSATDTIILLNMPANQPATKVVQLCYVVAILLTFPLMVFPATRILEGALFGGRSGKKSTMIKWQKNLFRALLCVCLALISWGGASNLDNFVSLIGGFGCIPLLFIYPALFHFKACAKRTWVKVGDVLLALFGFGVMIFVTYISIKSWATSEIVNRCGNLA